MPRHVREDLREVVRDLYGLVDAIRKFPELVTSIESRLRGFHYPKNPSVLFLWSDGNAPRALSVPLGIQNWSHTTTRDTFDYRFDLYQTLPAGTWLVTDQCLLDRVYVTNEDFSGAIDLGPLGSSRGRILVLPEEVTPKQKLTIKFFIG